MEDYLKRDYHMHTKYLGCANETMEVPAIIKECERLGLKSIGITDHLNSFDKAELHIPIKEDIAELETDLEVIFGVELNFMSCDGEFAYNEEIRDKYDFKFTVGGIHSPYVEEYDLKKIIDNQHRHHLLTCNNPLLDVVVHPYWFSKGPFDKNGWPWFGVDSMKAVPESYARELGQAAKETGTAVEINGAAIMDNPNYSTEFVEEYMVYLAAIAEEGAMISFGSDAHDIGHLQSIEKCWAAGVKLGLSEEQVWNPSKAKSIR